MTQMKFSYKLGQAPSEAVSRIVQRIYDTKGSSFMAIVEFTRSKAQEDEDPDREDCVWVTASQLEIGHAGEQEALLRSVQRALYLQRTADGTLDAAQEIKLGKQTLANAQGLVSGEEVARLRAALSLHLDGLRNVLADTGLREVDLRKSLAKLEAGMVAALRGEQVQMAGAPA